MTTEILSRTPQGSFRNEPFTDFSRGDTTRAIRAALEHVGDLLGHEYPLIIGGERSHTSTKIESYNPARPAQIIGIHQNPGAELAEVAIQAALKAFESWKHVSVEARTSLLLRASEIIRDRKFEFCAWLTYEVGKNWAEADADVAETIDFLEFLCPRGVAVRASDHSDSASRRKK